MSIFIGRKEELKRLNRLSRLGIATLSVIKGRRRVGKSTLVKEFAKQKHFISITGIPPSSNISAQSQRNEFAEQLCIQLNLPRVTFSTWSEAFHFLSAQIPQEETVVLLDEISWMGGLDPVFLGSLKIWWDQNASNFKNLRLILCGSISTWREENILCSTGFVGRIALVIHLEPFSLSESFDFLRRKGFKGSVYEIMKILSMCGGVPWYLDLVDPKCNADENIYELCFASSSQLLNEFNNIFHDLFDGHGKPYRKILNFLTVGMKSRKQIQTELGLQSGGTISTYLKNLILAGFITEHYQWSLKTGKAGRLSLYRLSDCFIRFHLKYIQPNEARIRKGLFKKVTRGNLPGWDSIFGIQLENLLLSDRLFLLNAIGIDTDLVENDNPYIQTTGTQREGCQIDYLIQTRMNTLFLCEFKFSRNEIKSSVIKEMEKKCSALQLPRGCGMAPVLFHINGACPSVEESSFFYKVIDLREYLEKEL